MPWGLRVPIYVGFMEDDEMDYTEAVEAAISNRKYLLNSLFDLEHFPTID